MISQSVCRIWAGRLVCETWLPLQPGWVSLGRRRPAAGGVGCCAPRCSGIFRAVGAPELRAARLLQDPLHSLVSRGVGFHLPTLQWGHPELASGTGALCASPGAGGAWPWVSPGPVLRTVPSCEPSQLPTTACLAQALARTPPPTYRIQVNLCILFTCLKRKK